MKKKILLSIYTSTSACICRGGTAGPSDDEIFLLIIPLVLFILYLVIPATIKFLKMKIAEWKEKIHIAIHEKSEHSTG